MNDGSGVERIMGVRAAVAARHSVESFDSGQRISEEEVRSLIEHALLTPSAFNLQHWRIVRVADVDTRRKIRELSYHQPQMTDASLLLVLCMDLKAWEKEPERYWANVPAEVRAAIVPNIGRYYGGHSERERDEAMRSCGMVAMNLMLVAQEMGYDSCPMGGFDHQGVARLIHLPEDHLIGMILVIGREKSGGERVRPVRLPLREVFFEESF
jgi:nitroreductase